MLDDDVDKFLVGADGERRIAIFKRPDGRFGIREEYRFRNIHEGKLMAEGWARLPPEKSIFLNAEDAERDACSTFARLGLSPGA